MSVIAVGGVPPRLNIKLLIRKLSWIVKGHFEALGFEQKKGSPTKTCYLNLSPKLNVHSVIQRINATPSGKLKFKAYVPKEIPSFPGKTKTLNDRLRRVMKIPIEISPHECFVKVHNEIIREMEYKYTGLLDLSKKTNHKLMENICLSVAERLRRVAQGSQFADSPFKLSMAYRKANPHFGDFQFILSTLHMIEDAQAQQRSQINEKELTVVNDQPYIIDNLPFDKAEEACRKYSDRIIKKVTEHINHLKTESHPDMTEEEVARLNVRKQLKNLSSYLPVIIKEVTARHFKPRMPTIYKVKIYGEPYCPSRDLVEPFLKKHHAKSVHRSEIMYNLISLKVSRAEYSKILAEDGTVIGGCKLIIRGADLPAYTIPEHLAKRITLSPEPQENEQENVTTEENWEEW